MVATSVKLFILELKNSALVTPPLSSTGFSRHLGSRQVNVWRIGPLKSLSTWNGALPPLFRTAYNMTGAGNGTQNSFKVMLALGGKHQNSMT